MKFPPGARTAGSALILLSLALAGAPAQEGGRASAPVGTSPLVRPGDAIVSHSAWIGECLLHASGSSAAVRYGLRGAFGLEGIVLKALSLDLDFGYRWLDAGGEDPTILPIPGLGAALALRLATIGPMALRAGLGIDFDFPITSGKAALLSSLSARVGLALRSLGRNYIALDLMAALPLGGAGASGLADGYYVGISLGARSEKPWILPKSKEIPRRAAIDSVSGAEAPRTAALSSPSPNAFSSASPDAGSPFIGLSIHPTLFSPDGDGVDDVLYIESSYSGRNPASWSIAVRDSGTGASIKSFAGRGAPPARIQWDGMPEGGGQPEPGQDIEIILSVSGPEPAEARARAAVDILIERLGERLRIRVPDIRFAADSDQVGDDAFLKDNLGSLEKIARLFMRFPGYGLLIEGHANPVYWQDPARFKAEEEGILRPLSERRAQTVMAALAAVGVDPARMRAVGMGASAPAFPFEDQANAWRNRRVVFYLVKP
jgi:outer membrane protein OmpA-like peptidoglycan-associated protein